MDIRKIHQIDMKCPLRPFMVKQAGAYKINVAKINVISEVIITSWKA